MYKATKNVKRSFLMPQANTRKLESVCNSGCIPNCQRNNPEINKATRLPKAAKLLAKICISKSNLPLHARFIPRWKYRFSSDQRSQATLGPVSTEVGDYSGTHGDLAFFCPPNPLLFSPGLGQQFVDVARFNRQFTVLSRVQ